MKARDVMISPVITVKETATVKDVAALLLEKRISAVPVVDHQGRLAGIVSEADLLRRVEIGTERRNPWWLRVLAGRDAGALDYVKANSHRIADLMTRDVATATPDTPLHQIAEMMERRRIKRVPILANGQLAGIVTRANLVQAIATSRPGLEIALSDDTIRNAILERVKAQQWWRIGVLNVTAHKGVVDLWGTVDTVPERDAIRVIAENTPGVVAVIDNLSIGPVVDNW